MKSILMLTTIFLVSCQSQTLAPSPNHDDHSKHVQDKMLEEEIRRQQVNSQVIFSPRP